MSLTNQDFRTINLSEGKSPGGDGDINEYRYSLAVASNNFNAKRKVVYINGMQNDGTTHRTNALALSWVEMCTVVGIYNATSGFLKDAGQCLGDKIQFNGPFVSSKAMTRGQALGYLSRNPAQVRLFEYLSIHRRSEIFAHSQGNLILSNVLHALQAVHGPTSLAGLVVRSFGSPALNWPKGLVRRHENAFTFDLVSLMGPWGLSASKVAVGRRSWNPATWNPLTHGFLEYLLQDAAFFVNRFRVGGLGLTVNMDEDGLACGLACLHFNLERVYRIFEHLNECHNSDADDIAVRYVTRLKERHPSTLAVLRKDEKLKHLLIRILKEGVTWSDEAKAIKILQGS